MGRASVSGRVHRSCLRRLLFLGDIGGGGDVLGDDDGESDCAHGSDDHPIDHNHPGGCGQWGPGAPQPPTWGSGSFTVGESASLSLNYLQIDTVIQIDEGASQLSFDDCLLLFSDVLVLQPGLSLTMKNTMMTSSETMVLRDGMHATFIGMNTQFRGNPSWVVAKSGETPVSQVCDASGTNCGDDLCPLVDCTDGGNARMNPGAHCVHGTCDCGDPRGHGFSGARCETHKCCCTWHPGPGRTCNGAACTTGGCAGTQLDYCDSRSPGWDTLCDRTC